MLTHVHRLQRTQAQTVKPKPVLHFHVGRESQRAKIRHILRGGNVQAKLKVNAPNDKYEQEADRVADQVMRMPEPQVQRQACSSPSCQEEDEDKIVQTKSVDNAGNAQAVDHPLIQNVLSSPGQPLDAATRSFMEPRFGQDFSGVRVHTDGQAAESARAVNARAFTVGRNVVFGAGQYAPGTDEGKRLVAHELVHVGQQQTNYTALGIQRFTHVAVADVDSLIVEELTTNIPYKWKHFVRKLNQRDNLIKQRLALIQTSSPQHAILKNMLTRWPTFRRQSIKRRPAPVTFRLPSQYSIKRALTKERNDKSSLRGSVNRILRRAIAQFITALKKFLNMRKTLKDEQVEYHRFDSLFTVRDVKKLLSAIRHAKFNSADVKALVSQETADLTNWAVHGISRIKKGKRTHTLNKRGFLGLGQHSVAARNEAIRWAASNSVTIPRTPDPRLRPATSIKLAAAYLGRIANDLLYPSLPAVKPSNDEFKKMTFAAYNGGFGRVISAAKGFLNGRRKNYTWNDIKNQTSIISETRDYVRKIVSRLT